MFKTSDIDDCTKDVCDINESQKTELMYLERLNPCKQIYYMDKSAFITSYHQSVDIFNFIAKLNLRVSLNIIGKPYSISEKGYFGDNNQVSDLIKGIKGLKLVLNGDIGLDLPYAFTLSSHEFYNRFETFDHYLKSLRSHYRYRVKKSLKKSANIIMTKIDQGDFNKEHHNLYLEVYQNSKDKLECLSMEFFRAFPSEIYEFRIIDSEKSGELVGFVQLVQKSNKLTFLFGGFKKEHNRKYDLYMTMLIEIIRIAIERKVEIIEFGQTAEETKLKIGCVAVKKYLYVHHSNRLLNLFIAKILPLLSYKAHSEIYNVFKEES